MFSALPLTTDIAQHHRHVGKVPEPEVALDARTKKKPPEGGSQFNQDGKRSGGHQRLL
jgi:hypothetical protein